MFAARRAAAAAVLATATIVALHAEACSADAEAPATTTDADVAIESSVVDAPVEMAGPRVRCVLDADCKAPNGCYTPHCDAVLGVCTFALCEPAGRNCAQGRCDATTLTCSDPKDYGLRTTHYPIENTTLGCVGNASRCFAAVHPFVFIGTNDDVVVLRVDDLLGARSSAVMRAGPAVKPAHVVASGRRLWIVGEVQGAAAPRQVQISWIDVPSDPNVARVEAQHATLSWPYPDTVAFPAPDGALLLAYDDANEGLPAALLKPPLSAAPKTFRVSAVPPGSTLVASSGARLVAYRFTSTVNLITAAATGSASVQPDLPIVPSLPAVTTPRFAQGPDGVVLLAGPVVADPPAPDCNCTAHERITWLLPNAIATSADVNQASDVEGITNLRVDAGAPCHVCPTGYPELPSLPVWIDAKTALIASPASDTERAQTAVRVIGRDPVTAAAARRFVTAATESPPGDFAVDRIAMASSNGFGYLLVADARGNSINLSLIDPRCDAK